MSFLDFLTVEQTPEGRMVLIAEEQYLNIAGSIHASAQYAFAEISSGQYLLDRFPEYEGRSLALLRKSTVKYRKPALTELTPDISISKENEATFLKRLGETKRAVILLETRLLDSFNEATFLGSFEWFISLR